MKLSVFATAVLLTTSIAACIPAIALTEQTPMPNDRHLRLASLKTPGLMTFSDVFPLPNQDRWLSLASEK